MGLRLIRPWEPILLVQENDRVRVHWDPSIPTDRILEHRRPDVVLALKEKRLIYLLEMPCVFYFLG